MPDFVVSFGQMFVDMPKKHIAYCFVAGRKFVVVCLQIIIHM
jgi:hypothetical protein